ncbi:antibiotic biosynthesis monooxygenase family protein [Acidovorax sp. GBBC 3334]|uniref:antibiotic biosynthesis monooxygenase family protein n=1 Tax=Acidovorax sp. GBBC 3334 TaxID=2940496 RepID=UPI003FA45E0E
MILEAAPLHVRAGQEPAFEDAFRVAQRIIASMPGYRSHRLERCIERPGEYLLLVEWDTLEAHEQGFRGSTGYQEWKRLLHHFYAPFPTVSHYAAVEGASSPGSGSAMPDAANTSRTTDSPLSAAGKPA